MNKLMFLLLLVIPTFSFAWNKIWYVSEGGKGKKDGTSWENAAPDFTYFLQNPFLDPDTILNPLCIIDTSDVIWVSKGRYSPILIWNGCDTTKGKPYNPFANRVSIYGGFEGWETHLSERTDWRNNESIIDGHDTCNCIWIEGVSCLYNGDIGIKIDGFTLENSIDSLEGGAIRVVNNSPLLSNIVIKNNVCSSLMYFENAQTNRGVEYNGHVYLYNILCYDNDIVIKNTINPSRKNAIITCDSSKVELINATLVNNNIVTNTSTIYLNYSSYFKVSNSILYRNCHNRDAVVDTASHLYYYCSNVNDLINTNLLRGTILQGCIDISPNFTNIYNDDYRLVPPCLCINTGDVMLYNTLNSILLQNPFYFSNYDVNANPRFYNNLIDMGALQHKEPNNVPKQIGEMVLLVDNTIYFKDKSNYEVFLYDYQGKLLYNKKVEDTIEIPGEFHNCVVVVTKNNEIVYSNKLLK